jgi:hypothetical protein
MNKEVKLAMVWPLYKYGELPTTDRKAKVTEA